MKVFIQQPVIPAYRVPLFNALANCPDFDLEVHASKKIPGLPSSADGAGFEFKFVEHECDLKLGGRTYSQHNMTLPEYFTADDVVVYNSNARFTSNMKLTSQAKKRGCRVIAWNHADSSTSGGVKSWVRKKLTSGKADDLLLYTEGEIDKMASEGWDRKNLYFLNNTQDESQVKKAVTFFTGINEIETAKESESVKEFREEKGIHDKRVFLFCGRITEKAELNILIEALAEIESAKLQKMRLIIIGDGDSKKQYSELAEKKGLICIEWLGAVYGEEKLAPWFLSADFFIYPGAIGLSINHAMSYGLPVITHNDKDNQMPEFYYLKDGYNGLTYNYRDPASLKELLCSDCSASELSGNAVKTMYDDFSFEKMVERFVDCLKKKD